ncbi:MAG: alkene reductase [Acidobacteriota bacterium]|nr:alkene reductase [Acidobacteriota bacterium]
MAEFFDSLRVGNLELKNRIIMSPMTRSRADDAGIQPDYTVDYYVQRASAGLIITEAVNISPMAKGYVRTPGIYTPKQTKAWKKVAAAVKEKGGKIFMQLFHTGRIALPDFLPDNVKPVAPSAVRAKGQNYTDGGMKDFVEPREITREEIRQTIQDFAAAAKNAVEAGFDGAELHAASGYIVQQFLSTNANLRQDEYGGSIENRARFLLETIDAMIEAVGAERVGIKLSPRMGFNDIEETDADALYAYVVKNLSERNLAYLHVSAVGGQGWHAKLRPLFGGVYFANAGLTRETGEKLLTENSADAIVYGALFLANPDLPERFVKSAELNQPDKSTFYTPGEKGYTDYPTLEQAAA